MLATAKDFPEMLEIQGRHAQRQMTAYSTQAAWPTDGRRR
jgi:hypothetical protein